MAALGRSRARRFVCVKHRGRLRVFNLDRRSGPRLEAISMLRHDALLAPLSTLAEQQRPSRAAATSLRWSNRNYSRSICTRFSDWRPSRTISNFRMRGMSVDGTTRTSRHVRLEFVVRAIADIGSVFRADQNWAAWPRFAPRMSKRRPHSTHRQDAHRQHSRRTR